MTSPADLLDQHIEHLHDHGRLRVWSLVITIFGDAIQLRGGRVAIADLQALIERARIEVGTLRTAMSRLTKDGWLVRDKQSRNSFYKLSPTGLQEFSTATRRIYAGRSSHDEDLTLGIYEPRSGKDRADQDRFLARTRAMMLRPGCVAWLASAAPPQEELASAGILTVSGKVGTLPDWVPGQVAQPERAARFDRFHDRWRNAHDNLSVLHELNALDAMVMRTLLIHDWRRTILSLPEIPSSFLPKDWPESECRAMVGAIYHVLLPHSESWWATPITPAGMDDLEHRFPMQAPVTLRNFISG